MEKQRREIDQKFEAMSNYKIEMDKNERIAKEDSEREEFHRRFERASKQNDVRLNHYLNNYYLPPKEKDLRNNVASERAKNGSSRKKKIVVLKKKKSDISHDGYRAYGSDPISHEVQDEYNYIPNAHYYQDNRVGNNGYINSQIQYDQR